MVLLATRESPGLRGMMCKGNKGGQGKNPPWSEVYSYRLESSSGFLSLLL